MSMISHICTYTHCFPLAHVHMYVRMYGCTYVCSEVQMNNTRCAHNVNRTMQEQRNGQVCQKSVNGLHHPHTFMC